MLRQYVRISSERLWWGRAGWMCAVPPTSNQLRSTTTTTHVCELTDPTSVYRHYSSMATVSCCVFMTLIMCSLYLLTERTSLPNVTTDFSWISRSIELCTSSRVLGLFRSEIELNFVTQSKRSVFVRLLLNQGEIVKLSAIDQGKTLRWDVEQLL